MAKKKKSSSHSHKAHGSSRKKKKDTGQYVFGIIVFIVLVAIVAGLIYLASKSGELRLTKEPRVAATVNGEEITTEYLNEQYDRVPEMYREFITRDTLLNQTINEVILLQQAEKKGITVSEEDVNQEIIAAMADAGVSEDVLEERLKEQNISKETLEELYRKQLIINELLESEVFEDMEVSRDDVEEFYDSRIRAMHILVETEDEADDIIDELKTYSLGEIEDAFGDIAAEKSTDPSAATNNGDLGEFGKGQMVPAFETAAFALEEYAFTAEPIQSQFGYHIILRLPKEQTLDDQYGAIEEFLLTQKKSVAVPIYIEQARSKADVEVFFKEAPVAVESED